MNTTTTHKVTFHGIPCHLKIGEVRKLSYEDKHRHSYLFLSSDVSPEDIGTGAEPATYDNNPENNKLWRKYNKAELAIHREVLALASALGNVDVQDVKYSRRAYCSCGCSPSWVRKDSGRKTQWIELIDPVKEAEREQYLADYKAKQEAKTLSSAAFI